MTVSVSPNRDNAGAAQLQSVSSGKTIHISLGGSDSIVIAVFRTFHKWNTDALICSCDRKHEAVHEKMYRWHDHESEGYLDDNELMFFFLNKGYFV